MNDSTIQTAVRAAIDGAGAELVIYSGYGGLLCASMRLDNFQNRTTDHIADKTAIRAAAAGTRMFHKLNLTTDEFKTLVTGAGFNVVTVDNVENMSFL